MKTKYLLLAFISFCLHIICCSQDSTSLQSISLFAGSSYWNIMYTENAESARFNREINVSPVVGFLYERGNEHLISFGCMGSVQRYSLFSPNQEFYENTGQISFRDYKLELDRYYIGFKASLTYLKKKHFQLYSALGGGFIFMRRNTKLIAEVEDLPRFRSFNVVPVLSLVGIRIISSSKIGLFMELAVGSPYLVKLGLSYKL